MAVRDTFQAAAHPHGVRDDIDETLDQWSRTIPDLDTSALDVILRITKLGLLFNQNLQRFLRPHHVSMGEMDVLFALLRTGPPFEQRPSDIARGCKVTTGATTGRVNRLVAAGFVERFTSPRDRRELLVRLTPEGKRIAEQLQREASHTNLVGDTLAAMSATDRAEFIRLLRLFTYGVEHPQGWP